LLLGLCGPAAALDNYRSRKGIFYGGSLGLGKDVKGAEGKFGYFLRGRVGGGLNDSLTLDGELGLWMQDDATVLTAMFGLDFFLIDGLYVRGMGGLANLSPEHGDGEAGFGAGGGLGYEIFANADLAIGIGADYQRHFDNHFDNNVVSLAISATMY